MASVVLVAICAFGIYMLLAYNSHMAHPLDNPLWASLTSDHRRFARGDERAKRYDADVAPFFAVPDASPSSSDLLDAMIAPGETVLLVGPTPEVPAGWELESLGEILQMVCESRISPVAGPPVSTLGAAEHERVLELVALVYPHYFRPRTTELGRYIGVLEGDRLCAMLGLRMACPGWKEISAVCTHPDHVGKGLARHLLAIGSNDIFDRGETPFLHVSPKNTRAIQLYEQNGFRTRLAIAFHALRRS
jgi:ribosomal protein S18 acetylase RimI-like enzyme